MGGNLRNNSKPSIPLVDNVNKFYLGNESVCLGGGNEKVYPGTLYENKIQ